MLSATSVVDLDMNVKRMWVSVAAEIRTLSLTGPHTPTTCSGLQVKGTINLDCVKFLRSWGCLLLQLVVFILTNTTWRKWDQSRLLKVSKIWAHGEEEKGIPEEELARAKGWELEQV